MVLKSQARREVLQLLGLLACAQEPLTFRMLTQFFGRETAERMEDLLTVAADFFVRRPAGRAPDAPVRFFHSRFPEFILEEVADHRAELHARLADACLRWRNLDGNTRLYALRYLPTHLIEASSKVEEMWDKLCAVLMDFDFLQAKIGALVVGTGPPSVTIFDLLRDFQNALAALPAGHTLRKQIAALHHTIDENSYALKEDPSLFVQQVYNTLVWEWLVVTDSVDGLKWG